MQNKRIAITGGIGSGKSELCKIIAKFGFPVFSCDEISNQLWEEAFYQARLLSAFPDCTKEGKIVRSLLSEKIFADSEARKKLNAISHPLIMQRLFGQMAKHKVAFAEVPLLFESRCETEFDEIIVVIRQKGLRISALKKRNGWNESQIHARFAGQIDYESHDFTNCQLLYNNGSVAELETNAQKLLQKLKLF